MIISFSWIYFLYLASKIPKYFSFLPTSLVAHTGHLSLFIYLSLVTLLNFSMYLSFTLLSSTWRCIISWIKIPFICKLSQICSSNLDLQISLLNSWNIYLAVDLTSSLACLIGSSHWTWAKLYSSYSWSYLMTIPLFSQAKTSWCHLDSPSLTSHIQSKRKLCWLYLENISTIPSTSTASSLPFVIILSYLDHCHRFLTSLPVVTLPTIHILVSIYSEATGIPIQPKSGYVIALVKTQQWFPMS